MKKTMFGAVLLLAAAALVLLSPSAWAEDDSCQVKISGTLSVEAEAVLSDGTLETAVTIADRVTSLMMEPGEYTLSVRSLDGIVYNERKVVLDDMATFRFYTTKLAAGNTDWNYGKDYTSDIIINNGNTCFVPVTIDDSGVTIVANVGDVADVTAIPTPDTVAKGFCTVHRTITMSTVKSVYRYVLPAADDFKLTVPSGADVSLGMKAYDVMVPLEIDPFTVEDDGEKTVYTYKLIVGYTYGFRVSADGFADRCYVLNMKVGLKTEVTREDIESLTKDEAGKGDGESGMLLNVNAEGFLRMDAGDAFELNPQRITYTDDDAAYGMYLSPEFHYRAIQPDGTPSDAVSFHGSIMRAENEGTAFILVTCDAIYAGYLNMTGMEDKVLYAGNGKYTGVFVVTVGDGAGPDIGVDSGLDASNRTSGSHFDSDLDVVYYAEEIEHGSIYIDASYSGYSVQYNPVYSDGDLVSFQESETICTERCRAEVVEGPNVVCVRTESGTSYQVVKASPIRMSVIDLDRGSYDLFVPGDEICVKVTGLRSPSSTQFYGADSRISLTMYGETYVSDDNGVFDAIVIPRDADGEGIPMYMKVVSSGCCPEFGSHRNGTDGLVYEERTAEFGTFTLKRYFLSDYMNVYLDTMVDEDWDSYASADAGLQGKTVDIGDFEVVAGKRLYLTLNRTSTQSMYGAKTITGTDDWMTCDTLASTTDHALIIAEPSMEDVGEYEFTIVLKLLNNHGTMKTTVTGTITVLDTRTVTHITSIAGRSIALPGIPDGTPIPEGKEFKSWNTEPDGTGTEYIAGTRITPESEVRLYAQYGNLDVGSTFLEDGLYYTISSLDGESGTVTVTGCIDSYGEELTIPAVVEYGGFAYTPVSIGSKAFYGNTVIKTADLTAVRTVGLKSFSYCYELKSLRITGEIGAYSFYCCHKLANIEIVGDSELGKSAFSECKNLVDVTFPDNVTIGKNAFYKCTFKSEYGTRMTYDELAGHRFTGENSVLQMYVSEVDEVFESDGLLFKVVSREEAALIGSSDALIMSLIVPDSVRHLGFDYMVTQIGTKAFYKCTELSSVDLGKTTSIGMKAFARCTALETVDLANATTISAYAFYACSSLKSLSFADGVTIGASAFYKCMGLERIDFQTVGTIGGSAFYGWVFWDSETGKRMTANAETLSGCSFEKSASKMVRV